MEYNVPARSGLTIDLGAITENYRRLRALAPGADVAAVIKADAYGLGAPQVAVTLAAGGCRTFYLASLDEALSLREICGAALGDCTLSVFNGLRPGEEPHFAQAGLRPVLNSLDEIDLWTAFCRADGAPHPAAIHLDTGMNRLGLTAADTACLAAEPKRLEGMTVSHWLSHLASPDTPEADQNQTQLDAFLTRTAALPPAPRSFANSAGVLLGPDFLFEQIRPGYALYGGNPTRRAEPPFQPAVRLEVPILQIRDVPAGNPVGYGATYAARDPRRLATLQAGYADGLPRALSNRGKVGIGGHIAPIRGRVSMDYITVDVTEIPDAVLNAAQTAELIGPTITIEDLADWSDTIGYEILTALGARYERRYADAAKSVQHGPDTGTGGC